MSVHFTAQVSIYNTCSFFKNAYCINNYVFNVFKVLSESVSKRIVLVCGDEAMETSHFIEMMHKFLMCSMFITSAMASRV